MNQGEFVEMLKQCNSVRQFRAVVRIINVGVSKPTLLLRETIVNKYFELVKQERKGEHCVR